MIYFKRDFSKQNLLSSIITGLYSFLGSATIAEHEEKVRSSWTRQLSQHCYRQFYKLQTSQVRDQGTAHDLVDLKVHQHAVGELGLSRVIKRATSIDIHICDVYVIWGQMQLFCFILTWTDCPAWLIYFCIIWLHMAISVNDYWPFTLVS